MQQASAAYGCCAAIQAKPRRHKISQDYHPLRVRVTWVVHHACTSTCTAGYLQLPAVACCPLVLVIILAEPIQRLPCVLHCMSVVLIPQKWALSFTATPTNKKNSALPPEVDVGTHLVTVALADCWTGICPDVMPSLTRDKVGTQGTGEETVQARLHTLLRRLQICGAGSPRAGCMVRMGWHACSGSMQLAWQLPEGWE